MSAVVCCSVRVGGYFVNSTASVMKISYVDLCRRASARRNQLLHRHQFSPPGLQNRTVNHEGLAGDADIHVPRDSSQRLELCRIDSSVTGGTTTYGYFSGREDETRRGEKKGLRGHKMISLI